MFYVIIEKSDRGGYGEARMPLKGLGMPGQGQFKPLGPEEKERVAKRKKDERKEEKQEDIKAYGHQIDEEE